jgi:hypothetical protein
VCAHRGHVGLVAHLPSKAIYIKAEPLGMELEVVVLELVLAFEEDVVHFPEASLRSCRLGCLRRPLGEWVYVVAREVAKDEANVSGLFQELLDRVIGPAAVRALELPVLNKRQRSVRITSNVVRVGDRTDESFNILNGSHKSPPLAARAQECRFQSSLH